MIESAIASLHSHDWYLHMLWEDASGWGATIRDALEGTCENHATARGATPEAAIESAMLRLIDQAFDAPEVTRVSAEPKTSSIALSARSILSALGLGPKPINRRKV